VRVALIAAPFIAVPPEEYGGTELFVAHLAEGLKQAGTDVIVYANGDSAVDVERRSIYPHSKWPIKVVEHAWLREINHNAWAIADAAGQCDIVHVHSAQALVLSRFVDQPFVLTLHGPYDKELSSFYAHYPKAYYVSISDAQRQNETMPNLRTIHHGIQLHQYRLVEKKQPYLSFIGRIAPIKGTHIAIDVAHRTGIPLKIAGEVQPHFQEYFERKVKPHIDGKLVEYIGPANLQAKNELLGNSMAMLFPIQWNEPFGLVMTEAMACGTPVLAMPGGSVREVVRDGVSGYVCRTVKEMVARVNSLNLEPASIRRYVAENFSTEKMVRQYQSLYEEACQNAGATPSHRAAS
jgi:glycosyltransferase involved in cell wall biosynthesis